MFLISILTFIRGGLRGFLLKIGLGESTLGFTENENAEYLGRHSEKQLEMLKLVFP